MNKKLNGGTHTKKSSMFLILFLVILVLATSSVNATDINNTSVSTVQDTSTHYSVQENVANNYITKDNKINNDKDIFYDDSGDHIDDIIDIDENKTTDINNNVSHTTPYKISGNNNKKNITIDMPNYMGYAGKTITINATVKTTDGNNVNSAETAFKVNGKTQAHPTLTNGKIIYNFKIPQWSAKKYTLTLVVGDTATTNSQRINRTLTLYKLNTTINTPYLTFVQRNNNSHINATVKDQLNRNVYTGNMAIKIDNKTVGHYNVTNGIVNFKFKPENRAGTHNLTIIYGANTFFNGVRSETKVRVVNSAIHTYTNAQILEAANRVKNYKNRNGVLPKVVVINNNDVTMVDFLYLMCQSLNSNSSLSEGQFEQPKGVQENIKTGNIYKDEYIKLAKTITYQIAQTGIAPGYIKTSLGTMMINTTIDGYSRALAFTYLNGRLPNYTAYNQSTYNTTTTPSKDPYLLPSKNCQSDSSIIISLSKNLTVGCTSTLSKATNIFNYVRDKIKYEDYSNSKKGAILTFNQKKGNCCDQAHLLVALLRASNIRAGYAHATKCKFAYSERGHVWGRIYINNKWLDADPTSSKNSIGNTKSNKVIDPDFSLRSELPF